MIQCGKHRAQILSTVLFYIAVRRIAAAVYIIFL